MTLHTIMHCTVLYSQVVYFEHSLTLRQIILKANLAQLICSSALLCLVTLRRGLETKKPDGLENGFSGVCSGWIDFSAHLAVLH
jgi:hypothetical protein